MIRTLIVLAMLAAGCEQLKSPQRLKALEDRVEKLSGEVAALKPGAGAAVRPGAHAGSGSAHTEAGSAHGDEAGSAAHGDEAGSGSAGGSAETEHGAEPGHEAVAAGEGSAAPSEAHEGDQETPDAGPKGAPSKEDRALADLREVVSKMTGDKQPGHGAPGSSGAPHWSYEGKTGPPLWGALDPAWKTCLKGQAQSPIDIEPKAGTASPIAFHYQATPATIIDNGHTLQVNVGAGSSIEIDGRTYRLLQFHFHTPSEHTIAGERYPLELHLVHQATDGKLAVIGVLYDAGAESRMLGGLWSRWPRKVGVEDKLKKPIDPSGLLPEKRTVFRYPGSLTTPPCTEGVLWNVMRRAMSDSKGHLEEFGRHYAHNAREPQALGDRKIE